MSAREELLRLYRRDGFLSPAVVLAEARNERSPLHGHFTWDEGEAAQRWRLHEAQQLIRRYKVEVEVAEDRFVKVRQFHNVGAGRYKAAEDALADPGDRDVVMAQAMRELRQMRRKYAALIDFTEALTQAIAETPERQAS